MRKPTTPAMAAARYNRISSRVEAMRDQVGRGGNRARGGSGSAWRRQPAVAWDTRITPILEHWQPTLKNDLPFDAERALHLARQTFAIEAEALLGMQRRLTAE